MTPMTWIRPIFNLLVMVALIQTFGRELSAASSGIHGRVLGHDEAGQYIGVVPQATISVVNPEGNTVSEAISDTHGYYKLELPPGEYQYEIKAAGYHSEANGRGLRLTQSQGVAIFNLSMTKGVDDPRRQRATKPVKKFGKLQGRVIEKGAASSTGVGNAKIVVRREGSRELYSVQSRGENEGEQSKGDYSFDLEAGRYTASVYASGFQPLFESQPIVIDAQQTTRHNFNLSRETLPLVSDQQGIRGVVTIVDSGRSTPRLRVEIESLADMQGKPQAVQLATSGAFSQALACGTYRVKASADGFPSAISQPVYVLAERYSFVNLTLHARRVPAPQTSLEVFVYSSTADSDEHSPLSGARVGLTKVGADAHATLEAVTDTTGHVLIPVTEAGTYSATAFLEGYASATATGSVQLGQTHEVGIRLLKQQSTPPSRDITLRVTVLDASVKRPLAGVKLLAKQRDETVAEAARGVTDALGASLLHLKQSGSFAVLAQQAGYKPGGATLDVSSGGQNALTVTLEPLLPADINRPEPKQPGDAVRPPHDPPIAKPQLVEGYVAYREESGQLRSVANAKLSWQRTSPSAPPVSAFATTSANGHYQVNVHVGTYQVRIEPPTGYKQLLEQVAIDATVHEKYFIVEKIERGLPQEEPLLTVSGSVVTEIATGRYAPVIGAELLCIRDQSFEKTTTNRLGEFVLNLRRHAYRLKIQAAGFETLETELDVHASMSRPRFILKRSNRISVDHLLTLTVVQAANARAAGAVMAVTNAKVQIASDTQPPIAGVTDSQGRFAVRLKTGAYKLRIEKLGFSVANKSVSIAQVDTTERVVLVPNSTQAIDTDQRSSLTIQVFQQDTRPSLNIRPMATPLPGAQVTVMLGAYRVATGTTGASGLYTVRLNGGAYSVKVECPGFVPVGKTIRLETSETKLDFQLTKLHAQPSGPGETNSLRGVLPGVQFKPFGREVSGGQQNWYVVEYRLTPRSVWTVLATKQTQQEANSALFLAIDRGQIPGTAETRIRPVSAPGTGASRSRSP